MTSIRDPLIPLKHLTNSPTGSSSRPATEPPAAQPDSLRSDSPSASLSPSVSEPHGSSVAAGTPAASLGLELSDRELVDELCLFFEDAWLRGRHPSLEPLLRGVAGSLRENLLRELLAVDLVYRRRLGENPNPSEYIARFPDLADVIRDAFPNVPGPAPLEFAPGVVIDRYQIERQLGRGAFGTVYLADDLDLGRQVAIKIPGGPLAATPSQIGRLLEEARAAAQLQHPSIVTLYDVQPLPDGRLYAVMKYVSGRSLREQLELERPRPHQLAEMFAVIADGLAYAHERGFVHRDLSPSNILLDDALRPMIADFGLAVHERVMHRRTGEQAGSWSYMAPEQVRGETHRLDGRTDIWALGVMLYEALTGRRPFLGETPEEIADEIQHRDPKPPRQVCRDVPRSLEQICLCCLSKAPAARYPTAGDLAIALRKWDEPVRLPGRRQWLITGAGLLLVALAWSSRSTLRTPTPLLPDPAPTDDRVDLLVWRGDQWTNIDWTSLLPLRGGDQIRIHVQTREPRYLYLVWRDTRGDFTPVHPWRMGDWEQREPEQPRTRLELPAGGADHVWTMEAGPLGTELLLVLGRSTPLPDDQSLTEHFQDLPRLPLFVPPAVLRFDYEKLERRTSDRNIDPARVERVRDPALELQRALAERLRPHFPWMQGLAFPTGS
jgi:serine/threonine protein kinase